MSRTTTRWHPQAGMNLVETTLVLLTVAILSAMIINAVHRFTAAQAFSESQSKLHEVGDRVIRQVGDDITFASHIFTTAGWASAYLAKCDLRGLARPSGQTAPTMTEAGRFEPDTADNRNTGNFVFLAKPEDAYLADLYGDRSVIAAVSVYRWMLYTLVQQENGKLDLARWMGEKIARLNDLERIVDPVQRLVVGQRLYDAGFRFAWEPGRNVLLGLMHISPSGSLTPVSSERVAGEQRELRTGMLRNSRVEVARNNQLPHLPVPAYGLVNGDFPGGFEIKVDATPQGRTVLVRLVLVSSVNTSLPNAAPFVRQCSNRSTT